MCTSQAIQVDPRLSERVKATFPANSPVVYGLGAFSSG